MTDTFTLRREPTLVERTSKPKARLVALVVEDEPMIALDLETMLESLGFDTVLTAMTLDEAREQIAETDIDYAVLDVMIAGETSVEIAELLIEHKTPFVFASGYGDTSGLPENLRTHPVLAKPLIEKDLEEVVAAAGLREG